MPFKPKPVIKVGKGDWVVQIPRPPTHATHARLIMHSELKDDGTPKEAILPLQDFGCFKGVAGEFEYIRMDNKRKISQEYKGSWKWDGYKVVGIEKLMKEV